MNIRTLPEIVEECLKDSREWFPSVADDIVHHALSMAGEVGEFCNVLKKQHRGSLDMRCASEMLTDELTDVFIYLCNIAALLGIDLEREYDRKRSYNCSRFGSVDADVCG